MKKVEKGMKMRIVGSDIKVISLSEGEFFGETTYLDRVETPGIIEVVSPEEGIFEFEGDLYQIELLDGEDGSVFINYAFEPIFQSEGKTFLECQIEIYKQQNFYNS